jgi:two-component system response regulator HydG
VRILVVDDEIKNAELTALALRDAGHEAEFVNGADTALQRLAAAPFDALVTDLRMPRMDGLELMREVRHRFPHTLMVMMTAYGDLEVGRKAMRDGAFAYVNKEGDFAGEIATHLARARRERELESDNRRLAGTVDSLKKGLATVIGDSPALQKALSLAHKVAPTDSTVLLRGESGTGKDLFARAIHFSSRRAAGPWVKVNCGALPENLLESELFGHEKGAFTGAIRQKSGRFEDADSGTLFLDEIGEVPLSLQVKLLQVIEEKTFTRVGGNHPITVDVRIITATNRDLDAMVGERQFREDLFFRLNVFPIRLPPLRERPGDIAPLVAHLMASRGVTGEKVSAPALAALERYGYPGNVRELEHTLERAMILAGSDPIGLEHLSFARPELARAAGALSLDGPGWVPVIPAEGLSLETLERELILQSLERAGGNKSQAARLLGLTRRTLYSRMEKHGLRTPGEGAGDEEAGDEEEPRAGRAGAQSEGSGR